MIEFLKQLRQHLLTGVSFAIPFIACGGILIAASIAFVPMSSHGPDFSNAPHLKVMNEIGKTAFSLMLPVLAGYIAYSVSGKPGLVPGFIGGYLADQVKAGFLGAIVAGLLAGYVVLLIKKMPVSKYIRPVMPILIIPILSGGLIGLLMIKVVGIPIADFMAWAGAALASMNTGNSVVLAMLLGGMIAFDMGGPVNKTAFFFGAAMMQQGNFHIMGTCAAAICTPPLGLGLATLLRKSLWREEEQEAGIAAIGMGLIGITEGAIPFAAADPLRIIPCLVLGSMVAAVIATMGGVADHAPHGGPIVLLVVQERLAYVIAIVMGTLVTAISANVLKSFSGKREQAAQAAA